MREKVTQIQETESPDQEVPKEALQDTSYLKWQNSKTKRIMKAAKEKQQVTYKGGQR